VERKNLETSIKPISSVLASEDAHRGSLVALVSSSVT